MTRLEILFHSQSGLCHYCSKPAVLLADLVAEFGEEDAWERANPTRRGLLVSGMVDHVPGFKEKYTTVLATVEHLIPRAWGGSDRPHNLVMACARCNGLQNRKYMNHNRREMREKPRRQPPEEGLFWSVENDCWMRGAAPYGRPQS